MAKQGAMGMNEKIHTHLRNLGGYKYEVTFDELPDAKVIMDEPAPVGSSNGPTAAMLLSSAVGHCLTASLQFCMEKSRASPKELITDVETSLERNEKGRWRVGGIKVNIKASVDDVDIEKLERCGGLFEEFCIVTASVRKGINVEVELEG